MVKKKKDKMTNNDLQNITHKTKDQVTQTPLKTGSELGCSGRVSATHRLNLVTKSASAQLFNWRYIYNRTSFFIMIAINVSLYIVNYHKIFF